MPLVRLCMDMHAGTFRRLPQDGGPFAQSPLLLECLRASWSVWYINEFKPANQIPMTLQDTEFMQSILPENYQPKSHYDKNAVKEVIKDVRK